RYDGRRDGGGRDQEEAPFPGRPEDHVPVPGRASFPGPPAADTPTTPRPTTSTGAHPGVAGVIHPTSVASSTASRLATANNGGPTTVTARNAVAAWRAFRVVMRALEKRRYVGLVVGLVVAILATTAVVVSSVLRPGWNDSPRVELLRRWQV